MLDIETLGSNINAPITTIGAVQFDASTGAIGSEFEIHLELQEQFEQYGRVPTWSTISWWLQQSEEARMYLVQQVRFSAPVALKAFCDWFKMTFPQSYKAKVWGNGASFDNGRTTALFEACGLQQPWSYNAERDMRTIVEFDPDLKKTKVFVGVAHKTIADCKHQIGIISDIKKGLSYKRWVESVLPESYDFIESLQPSAHSDNKGIDALQELSKALSNELQPSMHSDNTKLIDALQKIDQSGVK